MSESPAYAPSRLLAGDAEILRQAAMTRWLSSDLTQAAADFNRNLGLYPVYSECSAEHLVRYLFWRPPTATSIEVRSGRPRDKFEEYDRANSGRGWRLCSLHVNEKDAHSAVWVPQDRFEAAKAFLAAHGILTPERRGA